MTAAPPAPFVDTHAHLDDPAFDRDREDVLGRAERAGVSAIANVGYNPERWTSTIRLAREHPGIVAVLGLHPQEADLFDGSLLDDLAATIARFGARAVGEIGLDLFRNGPALAAQQSAFEAQLALATELSLPVVIHQRAAENELIEVLRTGAEPPGVLLHSFDGSARLARFAVERGYTFGVGGLAIRRSSAALREVLSAVPLASLVLETDAPYLAPAGVRARRNEPANVVTVAEQLAPLWGVSVEELAAATTARATAFFGLHA